MDSTEFHERDRDELESQLVDHHHHILKAKLNVKSVAKAPPLNSHAPTPATHTHKKASKSAHKVTHKAIRLKPVVNTAVPAGQSDFATKHDENCEDDENDENEIYVLHPAVQRMVTSIVSVASSLRSSFSSKTGSLRTDSSVKAEGAANGASTKSTLGRTLSVGSFSPSVSTAVSFNTATDSTASYSTRFPQVQAGAGEEGSMSADFSFDHADGEQADVENCDADGNGDFQQDATNLTNHLVSQGNTVPHTVPLYTAPSAGVSATPTADMYFHNLLERRSRPVEDSIGFDDSGEVDEGEGQAVGGVADIVQDPPRNHVQGEGAQVQHALHAQHAGGLPQQRLPQSHSQSKLACNTRSTGGGSDRLLVPSTMSSISTKLRAMLFRYEADFDCDGYAGGYGGNAAGQVYQPYQADSGSGSKGAAGALSSESGGFSLVRMLIASVNTTMSRKQQVFPSG